MTVRDEIETVLKAYAPAEWQVLPYTGEPDVLARPVVMVDWQTLDPGPAQGVLLAGAHVFILFPTSADAEGNEDTVDEAMPFVVHTLARVNGVNGITARRGTFPNTAGSPAWDIEISLLVTVEDEPDPEPEEG